MMTRYEQNALKRGYKTIAGIDEAGRGPLAGPVVAAAVILPPGYRNEYINDSKKLTEQRREELYVIIKKDAIAVGLGVVEASAIDRINILQATLLAMKEAVSELFPPPDYLLVDGKNKVPIVMHQETIISGDSLSVSIAAASIIAKVSRDKIMEIYHRQYPQYNFMKNKGYGTEEHREAIHKYGICKIHRMSFRVKENRDIRENIEFDFD